MTISSEPLKRRAFLKGLVGSGAALALAACQPAAAPSATTAPKPAATTAPAGAATAAATKGATQAPVAQAKVLAGQTVKVLLIDHVYTRNLKEMIPEFESLTGAKVELDSQAFQIANQRIDLELSGSTGALDVCQNTFIWSGKWIGANWVTDLTPFINDAQQTDKAVLDQPDFLEGAISPFLRGDKVYALPWTSDIELLMYRTDVFQKNNVTKAPATIDEMIELAKKLHTPEVAGNLMRGTQAIHLLWPQFLQSYGGNVFANPEDDMTPLLNTPAAVTASEKYSTLFTDYGLQGTIGYGDADSQAAFGQGKAAMWMDAMGVLTAALDPAKSTVVDKVSFALVPAGPAGRKPTVAAHGFSIPAAAKDKRKGWEFIKWATSKATMNKITIEKKYASPSRKSILGSADYKKTFTWGGADIGALQTESAGLAGKEGYMKYRTVAEFGPIGDQMIVSIGEIISKQKQPKQALDELQKNVIGILEQNGRKIRK
ncbi:MAG: ABC transporter substrate-binding protein [Chloroflexota bacterium]